MVVTLNKIERIKKEKDGLDIVPDIPVLAQGGWEAIGEGDRERLKWAGVFFRRQTPGRFMMRLRMPNGFTNAEQVSCDRRRRRGVRHAVHRHHDPATDADSRFRHRARAGDRSRLEAVGLLSLQTGMDNIRNVIGCAAAGLTPRELFDASPVVHEFTGMFVGDKAFTNLPRKFNVGISGCTEHCTHAESQDLALTPAVKTRTDRSATASTWRWAARWDRAGAGSRRRSTSSSSRRMRRTLCREIVLLFRDHGSRAARNRARLSFLLEKWGADRFRRELEQRIGADAQRAGRDARIAARRRPHRHPQAEAGGFNYVGLLVAVGRVPAARFATSPASPRVRHRRDPADDEART